MARSPVNAPPASESQGGGAELGWNQPVSPGPVAFGVARLRTSALGSAMLAVRANERSASGLGVNVVRVKIISFALAAFVTLNRWITRFSRTFQRRST